ncbi:exosortase X [Crocinitomix catalasitica]|uniref:exosortase X n=1 Tax=Crocinitomix catalasitica TaxID=184607 RepID=UPI000688EF7D|nr:archaeosortase/exosortase family protein [Crocinitomix catalasitica]
MFKLPSNKAARFLTLAAGGYIIWLLLYYFVIKEFTYWDFWINYNIVDMAQTIFTWFGVQTHIEFDGGMVILLLDGGNFRGIWVGSECNGFKLFSIFTIFLLAFPGPIRKKLWFIPLGLIIIHLANILRIIALILINNYYPQYLDFNHLYTFTIFVYAIIFLLWFWWAKKYSPSHEQKS